MLGRTLIVACFIAALVQGQGLGQSPAPAAGGAGKTFTSPGGTQLRVLVDAASLGGSEVEIAELTFKANSDSGEHKHGVTETFYVLEGELTQVVNGKPVKLTPGMATSIRATDHVVHRAGPNGAKALAIWAPGGEIARITSRWKPQ